MKLIEYDKIINVGDRTKQFEVIECPTRISKPHGWKEWFVKIKCDCGTVKSVRCGRWLKKDFQKCRGCQLIGANNYAWNGYGEINGQVFCKIRLNAKRLGILCTVSKKYLWELFLKQNRKCSLSGLDLKFRLNNSEQTASLDRIDSSKGYVDGNVQWIHKCINIMKNGFSEDDFLRFCKRVYEHNRNRIHGDIENFSNRRVV
jgi:hypothetical protein